jgi:acetyltransferase-like isoleucine patch superfamily enzyme
MRVARKLNSFALTLVFLLPGSKIKNSLIRFCGVSIGVRCKIGPILISGLKSISIGNNCKIGPFNVFRDLEELQLGDYSRVGQWNWVSASIPLVMNGASGSLKVGPHSAITSRHYFDVSGGVEIGSYSTIAGIRSTFITHGINWRTNSQTYDGISIGSHCLVSSNVCVVPGTQVPDRSVVAMGGTISGSNLRAGRLLLQPRVANDKEVSGEFFFRQFGYTEKIEKRSRD